LLANRKRGDPETTPRTGRRFEEQEVEGGENRLFFNRGTEVN
jgi:hypothetical protein